MKRIKTLEFTVLLGSIIFLLLSIIPAEGRSDQLQRLSGSFIDSQYAPLVINGITFSASVIYQNNIMYAPAQDYLNMLGISANLQGLPQQIILNNRNAPVSLLAAGPDRNTGAQIYYLHVTDTLNFLGIKYDISNQNGQIQITVNQITQQPQDICPEEQICSISGHVNNPYMQGGSVSLLQTCVNSARIPQTYNVSSTNLSQDGSFDFSDLPAGNYTVKANCFYDEEGPVLYEESTRRYYRCVTTYTYQWQKNITLDAGENFTLDFPADQAQVRREDKLIYLGSAYPSWPLK